jgi:hypothetical protein
LLNLPVSVVLPLPFCLRLRDGDYSIRHRDKVYLFNLRKEWSNFASGCNVDKQADEIESKFLFKATTGEITEALNFEIEFDKKGFFRHTVLCTRVHLDENLKPEEIPTRVIEALLPLVNKLLKAYRYLTGEFHITEIQWQDLCMVRDGKIMPFLVMDYPKQGQQRCKIIGWFPGDESPLVTVKPNVSKQEHNAIKRILLEEDFQVPIERDLMLNAKDFCRQGRYGVAVFELGTALEIAVNKVLLIKGIDEKRLRNLKFRKKYDLELKKFTGVSLKETNQSLFINILKIWNIRNSVVHKRTAVLTDEKGNTVEKIESKRQVEPLIGSTERTLDLLDSLSY